MESDERVNEIKKKNEKGAPSSRIRTSDLRI